MRRWCSLKNNRRRHSVPDYQDDENPEESQAARCACGGTLFFTTSWIGVTLEVCNSCSLHQPMPIKVPANFVRYESRLTLEAEIEAYIAQAKKPAKKTGRAVPNNFKPLATGRKDPNRDAA